MGGAEKAGLPDGYLRDQVVEFPEGASNFTGEMAKESYEKISREAEKGILVVKDKAQEGIDAIKDFIEKKKEEFTNKPPAGYGEEGSKE